MASCAEIGQVLVLALLLGSGSLDLALECSCFHTTKTEPLKQCAGQSGEAGCDWQGQFNAYAKGSAVFDEPQGAAALARPDRPALEHLALKVPFWKLMSVK